MGVGELLMVLRAGFTPLEQVTGTSVFNLTEQFSDHTIVSETQNYGMTLTRARRSALKRLRESAEKLGADGVVAVVVSLHRRWYGEGVWEMLATGTAVVGPPDWERGPEAFTCALSGQDFWLLLRAGYAPVQVVSGTAVWDLGPSVKRTFGDVEEVTELTLAVGQARAGVARWMRDEAAALGAAGVVGVSLTEERKHFYENTSHFLAYGTAVRPRAGAGVSVLATVPL